MNGDHGDHQEQRAGHRGAVPGGVEVVDALLEHVHRQGLELALGRRRAMLPLPKTSGSVKSCRPPIVDRMTTKTNVGVSIGRVIRQNCRHWPAPSMAAASYRSLRDRLHAGEQDQRVVAGPPPVDHRARWRSRSSTAARPSRSRRRRPCRAPS